MKTHLVVAGDCIYSLADRNGLPVGKIWDHGNNAELKARRGEEGVLLPGDRVFIPDIERQELDAASDKHHRFVLTRQQVRLRLRVVDWEAPVEPPPDPIDAFDEPHATYEDPLPTRASLKPRQSVAFVLEVGGRTLRGKSTADGMIDVPIPADAATARLTLEPGTDRTRVITMRLGDLDPHDEPSGVRGRLFNLGLLPDLQASDEELQAAVMEFQYHHGLDPTGELDDATRARLKREHGS